MRHHLHIEERQVADMCLDLYKEYGTTMAGLKVQTHVALVAF
jgi:pyrimidine and pyridine-specific 5'-nucleotidase